MKKLLAMLLALSILVGLMPGAALAAGSAIQAGTVLSTSSWIDEVPSQPEGYQSSGDTVTITSAEGFAWFAAQVNGGTTFEGKTVALEVDIDLSAHLWTPIGTQEHPFYGVFDGGGCTISGITITVSESSPAAGLFGYVGTSTIRNVTTSDTQITGAVTAENTVYLGGLVAANVDRTNVTIQDCMVDTGVQLTTTGAVESNIGGVLGYTDDYSGTYATISGTDVSLSVTYQSTDTNNTTNIGGVIGDVHSHRDTSSITDGEIHLSVQVEGRGEMFGDAVYHIGGAVGYMPTFGSAATNPIIALSNLSCDTLLDFENTDGILEGNIFGVPAELGGLFGRGNGYHATDCFSRIELLGTEDEVPSHFGNLAGYTYNEDILCERVYTYAVRHQGELSYENERLSEDNSKMPGYPLTDVYYIEPQELTEGEAGVPFLYKCFDDSHVTTPGINDGFVYSDGDAGDKITVTPSADQKMVTITPANKRCAVRGKQELTSGYTVDFVLPVPVYPKGGGTYSITCEMENGGYSSKLTTTPADRATAGTEVTVSVRPIPADIKMVDSVTVTAEDGTEVPVIKTSGGVTGEQTYTFEMPAADVTVLAVFRSISTEFTLSPSPVEFQVYEGYTTDDVEPATVTITNTGDLDLCFEGQYALPTNDYYEIQPADGAWGGANGREITISPGDTATFTVAPKPGLTAKTNPNTVKLLFYSTERESVSLTVRCTVSEAPTYILEAFPSSLTFEELYEGYLPPAGETVTLSNTGTGALEVQLPVSAHFDIAPGEGWSGNVASLAPGESAEVLVTPKAGFAAGTYQESLSFNTDRPGVGAQVSASFQVKQYGDIIITPAEITVYTGGEGYTGVVDGAGETTTVQNGLPEPGYYITLPEELNDLLGGTERAADLSEQLTLTYDDGADTTRTWKLELYGTEEHSTDVEGVQTARYIYRLLPGVDGDGQEHPIRLQITDPDTGETVISDRFTPSVEEQYTEYDMTIYSGGLDPDRITARLTLGGGRSVSCGVKTGGGKLTIRGLTDGNTTTEIVREETELPDGTISALAPDGVTYYIEGSNVELADRDGVKLLVDDLLDDDVLKEYIEQQMTGELPKGEYSYIQKYLALTDTKNGNASLALDEEDALTVYWPVPTDYDDSGRFYVVHFDGLDRNYDNLEEALARNTPEVIPSSCVTVGGRRYIQFETNSFSPFVLVYAHETGGGGIPSYTIRASAGEGGSISPRGTVQVALGSDKSFVIQADDTHKIADVLVDGRSMGAVGRYSFKDIRADHTIEAVFEPIDQVADPDDTGVSDWLNTEEHDAYLGGYDTGLFGPDNCMTRAEVAQMFYNLLLDKEVPVTQSFIDVPADAWYARPVNTLASLGIVNGVGEERFDPERSITRAEFTVIAMRFTDLETGGENCFSDVSPDDWFYEQVTGAIQYGWINGYEDGTFRPHNTITRAEVTTIVNRMLARAADKDYVDLHADELRRFPDVSGDSWAYYQIAAATNSHDYTEENGEENWTALG